MKPVTAKYLNVSCRSKEVGVSGKSTFLCISAIGATELQLMLRHYFTSL